MKFMRVIHNTPRFNVIYGIVLLAIAAILFLGGVGMVITGWPSEAVLSIYAFGIGFASIGFATYIYGRTSKQQEQYSNKILTQLDLLTGQLSKLTGGAIVAENEPKDKIDTLLLEIRAINVKLLEIIELLKQISGKTGKTVSL